MLIVETPVFTKQVTSTISDEDYRLLQESLVDKPDSGAIIPQSGGLRKLRGIRKERAKVVEYERFTIGSARKN